MINNIKKSLKSLSAKLMLVVLACSFALWGVGDIFSGGQNPVIAKVGNKKIQASEYLIQYQNAVSELRGNNTQEINDELLKAIGMPNNVINKMINNVFLDILAEKENLSVNKEYLLKSIANNPSFKDELGKFNKNIFNYYLQTINLTEKKYLQQLEKSIKREQILRSILITTQPPKILVRSIASKRDTARKAKIVFFDATKPMVIKKPTEEEVKIKFNDLKDSFKTPEKRSFKISYIKPEFFIKTINASSKEIKDEYEARKNEYYFPEERNVYQAMLEKQEDAQKIVSNSKDLKTFISILEQSFGIKKEEANLGFVAPNQLDNDFNKLVFSSVPNKIVGPIKTPFGWRVFIVNKIKKEKTINFNDVKKELAANIKFQKSLDIVYEKGNTLYELMEEGSNINNASKETSAKILEFENVSIEDISRIFENISFIKDTATFTKTLFDLKNNEYSDIVETEDGSVYLVTLDKVTLPQNRPLIDVREQILAMLTDERKITETVKNVAEYRKKALKNNNLLKKSASNKVTILETDWITEDSKLTSDNLNNKIVEAIFSNQINSLSEIVQFEDMQFAIVQPFKQKQLKVTDDIATKKEELESDLSMQMSEDILTALIQDLRVKHPVKINQDLLDSL